jgi:hypothetical protein
MMTDDDLRAIEERANGASDGPWKVETGRYGPEIKTAHNGVAWSSDISPQVWECDDEEDGCPDHAREVQRTAEFIAAARDDVPRLIAELRQLREPTGDAEREEAKWLVEATLRNLKAMGDCKVMLSIFTDGYEKAPIPLLQFALAMVLDKPIYFAVPKGRKIPENLRRVARGIGEYDPKGGAEAMQEAMRPFIEQWKK